MVVGVGAEHEKDIDPLLPGEPKIMVLRIFLLWKRPWASVVPKE